MSKKSEDPAVVGGMPEDGDEIETGEAKTVASGENSEELVVVKKDWEAEFVAMQQKLARLEGENAALKTPKQPTPKPTEPDWEELLFTDTKSAVALLKKTIGDEVRNELTNTYKRDQGEQQFWNDFYKQNDDLKEDDDLVKTTLNKHLGELADLPVKKASEKLAELTRERIMRYTGNTVKGGKKAVTEGAGQPSPQKKEPPKSTVVTLSDIIRARRAKRLNPKAATA